MRIMQELPIEIMRVRQEHSTLVVRLPAAWAKGVGVSKGAYLVAKQGTSGELIISKWEEHINGSKKVSDDRG